MSFRQDRSQQAAAERDELQRGLLDAGLNDAEVQAFLSYSEEVERDLAPKAVVVMPPRASRWVLLAAAVVLLVGGLGAAVGALLGERGAMKREIADLRERRLVLEKDLRSTQGERVAVETLLVSAKSDVDRLENKVELLLHRDRLAYAEAFQFFQDHVLELASMGDSEAIRSAMLVLDAARHFPNRELSRPWERGLARFGAELDPLGIDPSAQLDKGLTMVLASSD